MPANTSYKNLSDEALLAAYRSDGDKKWLGFLLPRYTALLFGVAMKYLKDKMLAEDAVQQVFLKALTHMPREEILNFKGWLYILMRNYCLQQLRDKIHIADEAAIINIPAANTDIEELRKDEHTIGQLEEALTLLNNEQRRTIELFYLKKYSYEQIMSQTGYSFMQVKSYIQNGKRNLKNILLNKTGKHSE